MSTALNTTPLNTSLANTLASILMSRTTFVAIVMLVALALWLRFPFIKSGMPYFYDEDEGHHYNRVVNMVKSGDFNPRYFLKPSLHFYLRMPVTAAAFLASVRAGELRELKDLVTRDTFGLSDYSFSASHPKVAKFNRAFSVCFSLASVTLIFIIALQLGLSKQAAFGAGLLTAVSPALVQSSAVIGVDVIVGPLVLLAVSLSIAGYRTRSSALLAGAALVAGLAASTKYNAAIVTLVPVFAALMSGSYMMLAAGLPLAMLAFLAATPYLLVELPLFLNHVAYEIWHYGIAGHVGNEGQPGLPQAVFYFSWLKNEALGLIPLLLAFAPLVIFTVRRVPERLFGVKPRQATSSETNTAALIFISFAVLYFAFMCSQKANFTRNMLVLVPFVALAALAGAEQLAAYTGRFKTIVLRLIIFCVVGFTFFGSALPVRSAAQSIAESRLTLVDYLATQPVAQGAKLGIAGELQIAVRSLPPAINPVKFVAVEVQDFIAKNPDVALIALPTGVDLSVAGWRAVHEIKGNKLPMRIVRNPSIALWQKT